MTAPRPQTETPISSVADSRLFQPSRNTHERNQAGESRKLPQTPEVDSFRTAYRDQNKKAGDTGSQQDAPPRFRKSDRLLHTALTAYRMRTNALPPIVPACSLAWECWKNGARSYSAWRLFSMQMLSVPIRPTSLLTCLPLQPVPPSDIHRNCQEHHTDQELNDVSPCADRLFLWNEGVERQKTAQDSHVYRKGKQDNPERFSTEFMARDHI